MRPLVSTYRLQFSADFTFSDAESIVPYLSRLGVSHIYASPILAARSGSRHGYDVLDHKAINPELGGMDGFVSLQEVLRSHDLGWIQDIVPNHMAFAPGNPLLTDIFEHGERSRFRHFFDIDWQTPYRWMENRVVAPFLGDLFGAVLDRGEITLEYGQQGFWLQYFDMKFPLLVETYLGILLPRLSALERDLGRDNSGMVKLLGALYTIESLEDETDAGVRADKTDFAKRMLWELHESEPAIREYLELSRAEFNGTPGEPQSFDKLNELHWKQAYRLSYWKVASEEINYRRFFSVNDLICLRVEDPEVFAYTHELILRLVDEGMIDGLRIDHIDGLYAPGEYLARLRERIGSRPIFVEKILHPGELLPDHWTADGTTGYESLNVLHGLFVPQASGRKLLSTFRSVTGNRVEYEQALHDQKRRILMEEMAGDLENLTRYVQRVIGDDRHGIDITAPSMRRALAEVMVHLEVYRTYTTNTINRDQDRDYLTQALKLARSQLPHHSYEFDYLESILLLDIETPGETLEKWSVLVQRFQQYTGPLMAKGLEDTLMYWFCPLLSLNEVGGAPTRFGVSVDEFHAHSKWILNRAPGTMTASSTHDTKRGEDTRLRISTIASRPTDWARAARSWRTMNRSLRRRVRGVPAPDATDEYLIHQTLFGMLGSRSDLNETIAGRLADYAQKAIREAKRKTNWTTPDTEYEEATVEYSRGLVARLQKPGEFSDSFWTFHESTQAQFEQAVVAHQALRLTMPGVPDVYQGTEYTDLTLVDPDNRRPVDWKARDASLRKLDSKRRASDSLAMEKLRCMSVLLRLRRAHPQLYLTGTYDPVEPVGVAAAVVTGFVRSSETAVSITIARRLPGDLSGATVRLPRPVEPGDYTDVLSGRQVAIEHPEQDLGHLILDQPAAVLFRS